MADELSAELRELKRKEFLEEKRRQRLRENNQELREIEKHLRTAYFVKSLKEQLATKNQDPLKIKQEESLELEKQRKSHEEFLKQQKIQEQQKKDAFRNILQTQITETVHRRQEIAEEMTRDRDHLDRLLKNLKLEQEKEKKELEERREAMKQEHEDFMRAHTLVKRKQRELDEQDRLRALEVQRQRDEEKKRLEELKKRQRIEQAALSEKIGLDVHKTELEKQRREQLMLELLEEERKAKEDYRFRENLERQVRAREQVRFELERFIEQRKLEKEMERQNRLSTERAELERIIAKTEKETLLEIKRLRDKEQAYNCAIQQMLEARRQERAGSVAAHLRDFELLRSEERKTQQEIEEERRRLLQNHSSDVLQYLPAGVLRESDREFLALPPAKTVSKR